MSNFQNHNLGPVRSTTRRPGKLAATLAEDLYFYDPLHLPLKNRHSQSSQALDLLTEVDPDCWGAQKIAQLLPEGSCRHVWEKKENQCHGPQPAAAVDHTSRYKFAGICRLCRLHLDVLVDYTQDWQSRPCPNDAYLQHHLVHTPRDSDTSGRAKQLWPGKAGPKEQLTAFECSSPKCSALVLVRHRSSRLPEKYVTPLIDPDRVNERARNAMKADPRNLGGCAVPSTQDVLSTLKVYLDNALDGSEGTLRGTGKKFSLRFGWKGTECRETLEFLGFRSEDDNWSLPQVAPEATPLTQDKNVFLDDISSELGVWMTKLAKNSPEGVVSAQLEKKNAEEAFNMILCCLSGQKYQNSLPSRRSKDDMDFASRDRYFTALGVPESASDDLVVFACKRQTTASPQNGPKYLSAARAISEQRNSEDITLHVVQELSTGNSTSEDLQAAYAYFIIPNPTATSPNDEEILGLFEARLGDSGGHEAEMKSNLRIIGRSRGSQYIAEYVEPINTYPEAMIFLNVSADAEDHTILAHRTQKVQEFPYLAARAKQAVEMIARVRPGGNLLRRWLDDDINDVSMDPGEAYRLLGVEDRTIETSLIETAYRFLSSDDPLQADKYSAAFRVIVADRQTQSGTISQPKRQRGRSDWPVGLENIGNTCYLNSLLQFLFTIPELRMLVLNFEDAKMQPTQENIANKKVGSRFITLKEVEHAQKFVYQLRQLFLQMIKSPSAHVTPEQDLTRLTLMTSTAIRRRSTIASAKPVINLVGPSDNVPVVIDPELTPMEVDPPQSVQPSNSNEQEDQDDNASDITLFSPSVDGMDTNDVNEVKDESTKDAFDVFTLLNDSGKDAKTEGVRLEPPNRPPPVPPRPQHAAQSQPSLEEYARQQDVAEVLDHVLFQLSCAIKPQGVDEDGEQLDQVKDLFYGLTKQHAFAESKDTRVDRFCCIIVRLFNEPETIYDALDGYFDVEQVGQKKRYLSISRPPPIFQIQIDRVGTDQRKNNHHMEVMETIFLDRYLEEDTNPALLSRRQQAWDWKKDRADLKREQTELNEGLSDQSNVASLLDLATNYLAQLQAKGVDIPPNLEPAIQHLRDQATSLLETLSTEQTALTTKLTSQFTDAPFRAHPYRLHAAFFHRGTALSGHYWIYIYDFVREMWLKYNDTRVEQVTDTNEIFRRPSQQDMQQWNGPANPYYLVYVRDKDKDRLVGSLCRDVQEDEESEGMIVPLHEFVGIGEGIGGGGHSSGWEGIPHSAPHEDDDMTTEIDLEGRELDPDMGGEPGPSLTIRGGDGDWDKQKGKDKGWGHSETQDPTMINHRYKTW